MLELLVLVAIAAFVLFRLKSVIGTRTGFEAPPEYLRNGAAEDEATASSDVVRPINPEPESETDSGPLSEDQRETLTEIRRHEPDFSLGEFLGGARGAYEMILMAYEEGDRDTLRSLLAPDVYSAFESGIEQRESQGLRVEARFIGVKDCKVSQLEFDPISKTADVSVKFVGELITAVRDAENRVVEGDPNEIRRQSDVWTFSREMGARDPNWLLTGTGS